MTSRKAPSPSGRAATTWSKAVDKALGELREDGTLAKISEKYFGADVTKYGPRAGARR